jgi:small-conductance mechanosensitive channel
MNSTRKLLAIVLVLLLGTTVYGLFRTAKPSEASATSGKGTHAATSRAPLVDQSPLKTAQQLAQLANTPEERPLAEEALRLGDHEVDLAFAAALRDAAENPPTLSPEAKEIQARLDMAQKRLSADQALVAQLTQAEVKATGDKKEALGDQLDLAKAELELDEDEVDDAKQDLIRAGGDPEDRIQEMVQEHDAAAHGTATAIPNTPPPLEERGLIRRMQQWFGLHQKQMQLWRAKQEAGAVASSLTAQHNALEARIDAAKQEIPELAHRSKSAKASGPSPSAATLPRASDDSAALVLITKQIASDQKALSVFDKRIDAEKQLSDNYEKWVEVVAAQQRTVINYILRGVLIILVIGLIGIYFSTAMDKVVGRLRLDRRQIQTLHGVSRVTVQVVAVLFILLVIFGPPGQLGTFLGLAGAGLTVALKDFIVGFIGWFVLMGKNGIRLGDWVEINGVTGEVVELGMFHTVLLETGNWTDSSHPTGRRVTFTNSFAIEGHYFNFSTSGQWLWDELRVVLPAGQDPYPIIDGIQKKVAEATAESVKQAEQEWKNAARSRDMSSLTAAPAMSVKPVVGGVEIAVRYVTRANERYQLRAKLYQAAVDLLGQKSVASSAAPVPRLSSD